jgi:hypothetical protein
MSLRRQMTEQARLRMAWFDAAAGDDRRNALGVEQRDQLGDVVAVAAGQRQSERVPWASVIRWCLEPGLRRSTGLSPVVPPLRARR